jgi:uncharacterized membrane protein YdfJ with MMPL/SSD domain
MTIARWMIAAAVLSWIVLALLVSRDVRLATFLGMLAPLAVAVASWLMAERAWRRNPESLTPVMIMAFGVKLVFFGAYVAVMLKGLSLAPVPFVASFAGYFIVLHMVEALALRRLMIGE